jgi:hypothetical protein
MGQRREETRMSSSKEMSSGALEREYLTSPLSIDFLRKSHASWAGALAARDDHTKTRDRRATGPLRSFPEENLFPDEGRVFGDGGDGFGGKFTGSQFWRGVGTSGSGIRGSRQARSFAPDTRGGGDIGEIKQSSGEMIDEVGTVAERVVAGDPPSLKEAGGNDGIDQRQSQLGFGLELGVVGDSAFFPAFPLIWAEPVLRKKEAAGEEGVSGGSGVGNKDTGLASCPLYQGGHSIGGRRRRIMSLLWKSLPSTLKTPAGSLRSRAASSL